MQSQNVTYIICCCLTHESQQSEPEYNARYPSLAIATNNKYSRCLSYKGALVLRKSQRSQRSSLEDYLMYIPQWYTWPGLPGYQMSQLGQKNYTFIRYNQLSLKYLKSPKKQISQLSGHLNRHLAGGTLQVLWGGQEYPMGQLGQKNYIFTRYSSRL